LKKNSVELKNLLYVSRKFKKYPKEDIYKKENEMSKVSLFLALFAVQGALASGLNQLAGC
jgi:hypothetical protein